jgi:hypothetical protein
MKKAGEEVNYGKYHGRQGILRLFVGEGMQVLRFPF